MGGALAVQWLSGYVLEWMLSLDNLFVFRLVLKAYKTPPALVRKAVFIGVIGALLLRIVFFMTVSTLLHCFAWVRWPFGLLLVWSGCNAAAGDDDDEGEEAYKDTMLVSRLRRCLGSRIFEGFDEKGQGLFIVGSDGRLQVTMLFFVVVVLELSDVLFALDSVSAKTAQIPNQYIAFSSSVLAIYGLRALFFVVDDLVAMFDLLKYGLAVILVWIGVELIFGKWIYLSSGVESICILAIFAFCILASQAKNLLWPEGGGAEGRAGSGAQGPERQQG